MCILIWYLLFIFYFFFFENWIHLISNVEENVCKKSIMNIRSALIHFVPFCSCFHFFVQGNVKTSSDFVWSTEFKSISKASILVNWVHKIEKLRWSGSKSIRIIEPIFSLLSLPFALFLYLILKREHWTHIIILQSWRLIADTRNLCVLFYSLPRIQYYV